MTSVANQSEFPTGNAVGSRMQVCVRDVLQPAWSDLSAVTFFWVGQTRAAEAESRIHNAA